MTKLYKKNLESSHERLEQWKNGDITTSERRILFTKWAAEAWEDYSTNNQAEITAAFKGCGMFNDVDGRENHLVKVQGCPDYEVPAKGSEPEPVVDAPKKRKRKSQGKNQGKKRSIEDLNDLVLEIYSCMCLCFVFNFLSSCNRSYLSISNFFIF